MQKMQIVKKLYTLKRKKIHTWDTAAKLLRRLGNEIVIETIFQRSENYHWSCILHWQYDNSTQNLVQQQQQRYYHKNKKHTASCITHQENIEYSMQKENVKFKKENKNLNIKGFSIF